MLARYTSASMAAVWSDEARYARWRDVELAVLQARTSYGLTPEPVLAAASLVLTPPKADIEAVEEEVRHDVVAFLLAWTERMEPLVAAHVHRGLTSSDVVDTAQSLAIGAATTLIEVQGRQLVVALLAKALANRDVLCVARTHGQPAAFDVIGHRFADLAFAVDRALERLAGARPRVLLANLTGPVGTGVGIPCDVAADAADKLGLALPAVTTQVLFRDGVAEWVAALALIGAVCEAVATDVRIGQHDGVEELAEPRGRGQEGSSAMPHKRNPVTAENVVGLARLLRSYLPPVIENVALWQHRDISHSSVERVVLPDAAALAEHVLRQTTRMIEGLLVDTDAVGANVARVGPRLASDRLLDLELANGATRREAMAAVRTRLSSGTVGDAVLVSAAEEVLHSEHLAQVFERAAALLEQYLSDRADTR